MSLLRFHTQRHFCPLLKISSYCSDAKVNTKSDPTTWRKPWASRDGEWYSAFKLFASEKGGSVNLISFLQKKLDLRPEVVRSWWAGIKKDVSIVDMRYIPERHEILGSDLAAAHFLVHRGAIVKFKDSNTWVKRVDDEYPLPNKYDPDYLIESIDLLDMKLFYEGFRNMTNLKELKWLSLKNSNEIDDWCIDRISGEYQNSLQYLDISNCSKVTHRGIGALYRMEALRTLKVSNISNSHEFHLTCLMLEELLPQLNIEGVEYINFEKND